MLEIRPNCENCNAPLPSNSTEAMICGFECTFCTTCVEEVLFNVCPNCGGGFEKRPIRPKKYTTQYPPTTQIVLQPVVLDTFAELLNKNKDIDPADR